MYPLQFSRAWNRSFRSRIIHLGRIYRRLGIARLLLTDDRLFIAKDEVINVLVVPRKPKVQQHCHAPFLFGMMVSRQGLEPRLAPYESAVTNQLHHRDIWGWAFDLRFSANRSARAVSSPQAKQPCLLFWTGCKPSSSPSGCRGRIRTCDFDLMRVAR